MVIPGFSPFSSAQAESLTLMEYLLTKTETALLVERWQLVNPTPALPSSALLCASSHSSFADVSRVIFRLSGGHVGCVRSILHRLRGATDEDVHERLLPDKLADSLFCDGGAMRTATQCAWQIS